MPEIATTPSDEALAQRVQGGDSAAFEILIDRYGGRIHGYLRRRVRDYHAAEDLTQATFVRAYRQIGRFDTRRRFAGWIYTIAARLAISHLRQAPVESPPDPREPADEQDPGRQVMDLEQREMLWKTASRCLSENQHHVLVLRYAEGLSLAETARATGLSKIYVKVLLHRARARLARAWREAQGTDTAVGTRGALDCRET
ncbi:MAG: ECF RNA polymerase sigma factor SigW [Lentisphaerae bacterium ADurb.BinA184]|nr:MAG: ECF RNA polymerase sigma factor SigW [Lentisphaerae bacterium ADurb.BinA184]